ncbi:hypothetical protein JTE90_006375 [Oedothorax gibbosus]|uniref:Metallo-beta-lactamase domain-containing protein 1 n=1 Tax=Oedothorax gibbosus TaxID=931172 RepID=A0AAV6VYH6_9ARAC|nr:hypothetical protein JTE90_006375 [Oedothorax gibbosus]
MDVTVTIIKTGYSSINSESNIMKANCTCTLVENGKFKLIIDTLTAWDGEFLTQELKKRGVELNDVTHAVATHGHSDHIGNLNLFKNAVHIVGQSLSHKDEYQLYSFDEGGPYKISPNIEIIATPGHTLSDVSVIVKNTTLGTVAIVGDLFEREEDIRHPDLWKITAGSENPELQIKNRRKILNSIDYVIPGHGPGFKGHKDVALIMAIRSLSKEALLQEISG